MKKIILAIALFFGLTITVNAATYSISVGSKGLTKGGSTKLTVRGDGVTGRFNIKTSNASVVSVSEGSVWVENNSYSVTLKALNTGSATITVTPSSTSDSSGNAVSLSSKSITVTVAPPREKSTNNNLKSLKIEGFEVSPEFDKDTTEYTAVVPSTTDKINIIAEKADGYASITGAGEAEVKEGANDFEIVVTSETGVAKTYKLTVTVEDINPIEVDILGNKYTVVKRKDNLEKPIGFEEMTVKISEFEIPAFRSDKLDITLVGLKDESGKIYLAIYNDGKYSLYSAFTSKELTVYVLELKELKGYKKYKVDINGIEVDCYKYSKNSDFAIVYGKNVEIGEEDFYVYDIKDKTFQRYDEDQMKDIQKQIKNYTYVIYAFAGALGLIFIIFIISKIAKSKRKRKLKKQEIKKEEKTKELESDFLDENSKKKKK